MKSISLSSLFYLLCFQTTQLAWGLSLGGIGLNISLEMPNIKLGINVNGLISPALVELILSRPVPQNKIPSCTTKDFSRNGLISGNARWYQYEQRWWIPAVIDSSFSSNERNEILAAMNGISQKTCVDFYEYSSESQLQGYDYVYIMRNNDGCWSRIGREHKGRQNLNLGPNDANGFGCIWAGVIMHELIHAIGFFHQHVVPDRDNYVTVYWDNISPDPQTRSNYDVRSSQEVTSYGAPYDYDSIMHYRRQEFYYNGRDSLVPKQNVNIGQRDHISNWDAYKIQKMHGCPA